MKLRSNRIVSCNEVKCYLGKYNQGECARSLVEFCQAQPKPKSSWAELAIKSYSDNTTNTTNTNRGSIKWAEIDSLNKF